MWSLMLVLSLLKVLHITGAQSAFRENEKMSDESHVVVCLKIWRGLSEKMPQKSGFKIRRPESKGPQGRDGFLARTSGTRRQISRE